MSDFDLCLAFTLRMEGGKRHCFITAEDAPGWCGWMVQNELASHKEE